LLRFLPIKSLEVENETLDRKIEDLHRKEEDERRHKNVTQSDVREVVAVIRYTVWRPGDDCNLDNDIFNRGETISPDFGHEQVLIISR